MRRLHGVAYPATVPPAPEPVSEADTSDERAMALRFVRTGFHPPLPDAFATWYTELLATVCDGGRSGTVVSIPQEITDLGFTFDRAEHTEDDGLGLTLADALRAFGRDDLLWADGGGPVHASTDGATSLAAALVAYGIRTTTTLHRSGGCTVQLTDDQAAQLAERLIPLDGSTEDELGIALGLLDCVTQSTDLTCSMDHHGRCQEHGASEYEGKCAEPQAHAFLVRHSVREEG